MAILEMTLTSPRVRKSVVDTIKHMDQHNLVRTTRTRIIRLQNDFKGLMSKIENGLHGYHASVQLQSSNSQAASSPHSEHSTRNISNSASNSDTYDIPFAKVTDVAHGSPADEAGLRPGDKIRKFGTVNWMNHEKLSKVSETVQRSAGVRTPLQNPPPKKVLNRPIY